MFSVDKYDDVKWGLPGWRIEQRYKNDVLIGNWNEERGKFKRGNSHFNSTQRTDFQNYGKHLPDVKVRREAMLQTEGLGKHYLFSHHGEAYKENRITWYDQQFNKRELTESNFKPLRTWERQRLAWAPEKSDYPIQGRPTNFGLLEKKQDQWKKETELEDLTIYATTQQISFFPHQRKSYSYQRFAAPKFISSKFHPHQVNKNLHLRGSKHLTVCEYPPVLAPVI